ncbi:S41 family peptidase [Aurantiacibacter sp. MUD11]|uniref:S41 family peptidase n=1 Tax=Aurantiacibacter sp. MUD11 TaxID=3003265 RepID=UPI0022AB272F|nr:S41 family peptidase [Aurantiacibacter sp. MUD11]WAT18413.1 S41 family peptidase [Aurantiacibacter sp. MUD11]
MAQAREDLTFAYEQLQAEHVDLYGRRPKAEYDAHFTRLLQSIDGPVARPEFHLILHDLLAYGNVAHAKVEAAIYDQIARIQAGEAIIPLSVVYHGEAMLTDRWAAEGNALPPGSRITALGDLTIAEFEAEARRILSADTDRLLRAQLELTLPAILPLVFGEVEALEVAYVDPAGQARTFALPSVSYGEMAAIQDARPVPGPDRNSSARVARDLGDGVFYLQPGPFFALPEEQGEGGESYDIDVYDDFVRQAFADANASGAQDLIVDLRGNPGGDVSFSDLIVRRLVQEPYRFASRYEVRAGANTLANWQDMDPTRPDLTGRVAAALAEAQEGEVVAIDLPLIQPLHDHRFDGRVWWLTDRHSYSNAAVLAAMVQDLEIGTVIGEATSDLPSTYGATESFTLPHSQQPVTYPKSYMVRLSGDERARGVIPDFVIAPNPVGEERDLMLDTVLVQIRLTR